MDLKWDGLQTVPRVSSVITQRHGLKAVPCRKALRAAPPAAAAIHRSAFDSSGDTLLLSVPPSRLARSVGAWGQARETHLRRSHHRQHTARNRSRAAGGPARARLPWWAHPPAAD